MVTNMLTDFFANDRGLLVDLPVESTFDRFLDPIFLKVSALNPVFTRLKTNNDIEIELIFSLLRRSRPQKLSFRNVSMDPILGYSRVVVKGFKRVQTRL